MNMKTVVNASTGEVRIEKLTEQDIKQAEIDKQAWEAGATDRQWQEVRNTRAPLLLSADHLVNTARDNDQTDLEREARAYRQALRDITKQKDPFNIAWPAKPGG